MSKREFTHSELSNYQDCPKKWWFKYDQRLSAQRTQLKLSFGKVIHEALSVLYCSGFDPALDVICKAVDALRKDADHEALEELTGMSELGISMLTRYAAFAKAHDDFDIVEVETPHTVPVIASTGNKSSLFEYTFTCDQILRRSGKLWIHEFKTAEIVDTNYLSNLVLDEQMSRYLWATEKTFNEPVEGVIYTILRKKAPRVPELLKKGGLSKAVNIDTTYEVYLKAVQDNGLNPADYVEVLDILKAKGDTFIVREMVLRNDREKKDCERRLYTLCKTINTDAPIYKCPSRDCSWKCDFRNLCIEDTPEVRSTYQVREDYHPEHAKEKVA